MNAGKESRKDRIEVFKFRLGHYFRKFMHRFAEIADPVLATVRRIKLKNNTG